MSTDLANRALLVSMTINSWSARKLDRRESAEVALRNGATTGAARVNKALLPMARSLDLIQRLTNATKAFYYDSTLPWVEGLRIIRTEGYTKFAREMGEHKIRWDAAVREFAEEYPQLREDAKFLLGNLYSDDDYPSPDSVADRFRMDIAFYPVPSANDWRVDLADAQVEKLRAQIAAQIEQTQAKAMKAAWQRIYDVVSRAHERLSKPDNVFRDTLVENAVELCEILPTLNIADDPKLEQLRRDLEGSLCQCEPKELRENLIVREEVSNKLAEIMAKMGAMYS